MLPGEVRMRLQPLISLDNMASVPQLWCILMVEHCSLFLFLRAIPGGRLEWSPNGSAGGAAFSRTPAILLWPHGCPGCAPAAHARSHGLQLHVRWRPTAAFPQVLLLSAWSPCCCGLAHLSYTLPLSHYWSEGAAGDRGANAGGATDTPGEAELEMRPYGDGALIRTKSPLWRWPQQVPLCCPRFLVLFSVCGNN